MNKNYCIYKHQCKDNGQIYIGQTCQNVNRRWRDGEGYKGSPYFYAAICTYGQDRFTHEILECGLTAQEANEKEKYYIKYYNSDKKGYGYNLTSGGENKVYNQDSRNKMSESAIKRFDNIEERKKQSERIKAAHKKENNHYDANKKPVRCLETGEIFESTTLAAKQAGINSLSSFGNYFRGTSKSCGRHPETGERLHQERLDNNNNKEE